MGLKTGSYSKNGYDECNRSDSSHSYRSRDGCDDDYTDSTWFRYLPVYIAAIVAFFVVIGTLFNSCNAAAFLVALVIAVIWVAIIYWLADLCELGWAWFFLLLPLILLLLVAVVAAGTASGIEAYKRMYYCEDGSSRWGSWW